MKKRILSILLILCMVLSMLPLSAFATDTATHLTVLETAPATATVAAGGLYELDLSTVFADTEGHTLTYALSGGDFGEHTKIADGKLAFTVSTAGEYKPTLTATCTEGERISHTVTVTVTEADEGSERQYGYDETASSSVTVYVTLSNDGMPVLSSNDSDTVMAALKVTVPYFDLKLYGLEDYYRYRGRAGQLCRQRHRRTPHRAASVHLSFGAVLHGSARGGLLQGYLRCAGLRRGHRRHLL